MFHWSCVRIFSCENSGFDSWPSVCARHNNRQQLIWYPVGIAVALKSLPVTGPSAKASRLGSAEAHLPISQPSHFKPSPHLHPNLHFTIHTLSNHGQNRHLALLSCPHARSASPLFLPPRFPCSPHAQLPTYLFAFEPFRNFHSKRIPWWLIDTLSVLGYFESRNISNIGKTRKRTSSLLINPLSVQLLSTTVAVSATAAIDAASGFSASIVWPPAKHYCTAASSSIHRPPDEQPLLILLKVQRTDFSLLQHVIHA